MNHKNFSESVIVSPDIYPCSAENLKSMGIEVLFSCENKNVSQYLRYHADMQIASISHDTFVAAPECFDYYEELLKNKNVNVLKGNTYLSCNYPADIAYNIIVTENCAIHNFKYTDSVLKSHLNTKKLINVSQGYTACTLRVISENAFITSDRGLYKILKQNKSDVLLINDDSILLPGFDHGFFGGSSVMLSADLLAVNGRVEEHPDYDNIKAFCLNYGVELLSLSNSPVMDIGSFILV